MKYQKFKLQVPLNTNYDEPLALVYNKDRSEEYFIPIDDDIKSFMAGSFKKYLLGAYDGSTDHFIIDREIKAQNW